MRFNFGGGGESKAQRDSLPKDMVATLARQFSSLAGQDLAGFTFEQKRSAQTGAKFDISIYDGAGVLRYEGRKFGGSQGISFWKPNGELTRG